MGTSHFNRSYSIRSCSFLSKIFLLILTGSIASKGINRGGTDILHNLSLFADCLLLVIALLLLSLDIGLRKAGRHP